MKKEYYITILLLLVLWSFFSVLVGNDILIPYPYEVLKRVVSFFINASFYQIIFTTLLRVIKGYVLSFGLALVLSILADRYSFIKRLFEPIFVLTKTIPNISYIIIALIWLGSEGAVSIVTFLILFPVFYNNFIFTLENESQELRDVSQIYPESFLTFTIKRTIPLLYPTFLSTSKTALSLGFKVGVMAEILGQVKVGIGKQLYLARLNLDTTGIFAWTCIIILICIFFDLIFNSLLLHNKEDN